MKLSFRIMVVLFLSASCCNAVKAQVDPHFTQYYVYPSWLNPALTGAFDGNYRISGIYRSQWGNITSPFSTPGVSLDFTTNKDANFGVSVLNQKAGDGGYSYTTAYASGAYTGVRWGALESQRLVIGLQIGMIQRRFNPTKLSFGDQWNPITGYNPSNQTADQINAKSSTSFDAGAGILYYDAMPGKKANLFAGASLSHLTKPKDQFSLKGEETIPQRFTAHAGLRLNVSPTFSITPNVLYLKQGTASEKMIGAYGQFKASTGTDFMLGANYRFDDAITPFAGYTWKNMVLGVSYDVNTSDLGKMVNGASSIEISLSFIGRKSVKTPDVEFVCPRL